MSSIPSAKGIDSTLALLRNPYEFIPDTCRDLEGDLFETRILFQKTICMTGAAAAEVFYSEDGLVRAGSMPKRIQRTLLGEKGIQGLDGEALRRLGGRAARAEAAMQWAQDRANAELGVIATDGETTCPAKPFAELPEEIALRLIGAELARLAPQAFQRLERLETLAGGLRAAILRDDPFAATLAGCTIRFRRETVIIARAPARRTVDMTNLSPRDGEDRYLSSPPLLGKAGGDA